MNDSPMNPPVEQSVSALTDPAWAPLFWRPARLGVESAWYGHVPFAHWLVTAQRPSSIVELGSHNGVSYAAFCEAVLRAQIDARCLAVDTWQGDKHAGFYGDEVLADLRHFHDERYGGFSTLLRATFDEALDKVQDGSIDLLHIDGRHTFEDARHDFTAWQPKLSPSAIVLFHDTNVREQDFGVWRLWAELAGQYPSFEFLHGHGLGVLALGSAVGGPAAALFRMQDGRDINAVRERFALLGERWIAARDLLRQKSLENDLRLTQEWASKAQEAVNTISPAFEELLVKSRQTRNALAAARHDLAALEHANAEAARATAENENLRARLAATEQHAAELAASARAQIESLYRERELVFKSTSWRLTAPLRAMRGRAPTQASAPSVQLPGLDTSALPPAPKPAGKPIEAKRERLSVLFVSGEDHTPGTVYRCERYAAAAAALGYDARSMPVKPVGPDDLAGRDVVVLWRTPFGEHIQGIIDYCREHGILVAFDVDDLMFRPELAVIDIIDGIRSQRFSELHTQAFFSLVQRTLKAADIVTCPTEELAHAARCLGRPAWVMPNCFDDAAHATSRQARAEWLETNDGLLRIGYAGGSRTHQKDFAAASPAIAQILRDMPHVRLTLFRDTYAGEGLVLMHEFPDFADLADKIEWRDMVPLAGLPRELARFTVNIAPLEADNPFCEAKSELKYFEAALSCVPTVASPAGPFRRAMTEGVTGYLAATTAEWHRALTTLLTDAPLRARIGQNAYHDALAHFGPHAQMQAFSLMLGQARAGLDGAAAFERARYRASLPRIAPPHIPESEIIWHNCTAADAAVTIIVPLYNYADFVGEALESAAAQTLRALDLVVIDDTSPDDSNDMALLWLKQHAGRFGRATLLRHRNNASLGFARNSGFAHADTPFVLPLDADNRLRPNACEKLLATMQTSHAAFAYPAIQAFGMVDEIFGTQRYSVLGLQQGNYIDAMALVRKSAWAAAGGYDNVRYGWEDYDFWCRLAERGHFGIALPEVLADYRVHAQSMLHTTTEVQDHKGDLIEDLTSRHPWLDLRK